MVSKWLQRLTLAAVLAGGLGSVYAETASALPLPGARRPARPAASRGFNLFAGSVDVWLNANRVQCNINNLGEQCVAPAGSTVAGGGFWPVGSPDQYVFNAGIQTAAIIDPTSGFAWAGDTVATYFFDPRGDQTVGFGLTPTYNSLVSDDIANWPSPAFIRDTTLFDKALVGAPLGTAPAFRQTISQQDTWTRYWDGNVNIISGRPHPMGLLVDQRTLAWGFPAGNQDIVYFIMRFINVTSGDPADYAGLSKYGYTDADIADVVTLAQQYRAAVLDKFGVAIPAHGYAFKAMYVGASEDPDEGNAGSNYSTVNLPFSMDWVYKSNFFEPNWLYPGDIFGIPPFTAAPGMQGSKFLKGPARADGSQIGVTMFTNTTNGGAFPDRVGSPALYRLMKADLIPADGTCLNAPPNTPLCALVQSASDTRMFMYSGPINLAPGASEVLVVSFVFAAPIAAAIQTDGFGHSLGSGSFDLPPGVPGTPTGYISASSRAGQTAVDTIRKIDRAVGWAYNTQNPANNAQLLDANGNGVLEQTEIPTVKGSLLNKALVAQAVFDAKFLLPFSPDAPKFYAIPGDNQVTVVWQPSATELPGNGDPYFAVAASPLRSDGSVNPLYDPNFRRYDVEGYRVWRGRSPSSMVVVASFDYSGTTAIDYTGQFHTGDYGSKCAPELSITSGCPALPFAVELVGDVVQVKIGDRLALLNGDVVITKADTAVTGGATGYAALQNTGVPFVYVDHTALNGFRYYYSVTAFDVNSINSGPTSLQSALTTVTATPRAISGQEVAGTTAPPQLVGGDGSTLDPNAPEPTVNAATGIFSGPQPPTNGINVGFAAFLPQVLVDGNVTVTVDSVVPGAWLNLDYTDNQIPATYWFTGKGSGAPVKFSIPLIAPATAGPDGTGNGTFLATQMDSARAARFGGDNSYALYGAVSIASPGDYRLANKSRANVNGDPAGPGNGPRWWAGATNENTNDPNGITCVTVASFTCVLSDLSRNAGAIAGVGIFNIVSYNTVGSSAPARDIEGVTSSVFRAADFKWYWGANGAVDSVVDLTHHIRVPFAPTVRASWGILNDSSFVRVVDKSLVRDTSITRLTWTDYACVPPFPAYFGICGGADNFAAPDSGALFQDHARLSPVNFASSTYAGSRGLTASAATGNGFILYLAGNFFLMQMASLPTAGTAWYMRAYSGNVAGNLGEYSFEGATRPPAVPGLKIQLSYTGSTLDPTHVADSMMARIHTVPDPYYVTNALENTANSKVLRFVNLPSQAIIRIYSVSGVLVNVITHNDPTAGGEQVWNLRNRNNQFVASGVYFYHVETPDGKKKIGRFTVVNYAQ